MRARGRRREAHARGGRARHVAAGLLLLTRGRRVKVTGGPLHGLEGFVDDPANPQGIVVSVDVLRQGLLVRLPVENLIALP